MDQFSHYMGFVINNLHTLLSSERHIDYLVTKISIAKMIAM